jgi:hypothetical protein
VNIPCLNIERFEKKFSLFDLKNEQSRCCDQTACSKTEESWFDFRLKQKAKPLAFKTKRETFLKGKCDRSVKLNNHLYPTPCLRILGMYLHSSIHLYGVIFNRTHKNTDKQIYVCFQIFYSAVSTKET